jgi:prefoldin subunit 5
MGNPYLRILRSQLEPYIVPQLGSEYLASKKCQTELRTLNKEIADLRKKLAALEARKAALDRAIKT